MTQRRLRGWRRNLKLFFKTENMAAVRRHLVCHQVMQLWVFPHQEGAVVRRVRPGLPHIPGCVL